MDKITQLLDIIEHPEKYSDEMLEKLLSDEQLSQYYEVMALASSAYNARRAKTHESDDVDEAWKEFQSRNAVSSIHPQWWRAVAVASFIKTHCSGWKTQASSADAIIPTLQACLWKVMR